MKKFLNFKIAVVVASFLVIFSVFVAPIDCFASDNVLWDEKAADIKAHSGLGNQDPRLMAANIINIVLGFLGLLSVILILFGGFKWMTAAGNDDQVASSKKLLIAAVIGLVIILSSYALAAFILDAIYRTSTQ